MKSIAIDGPAGAGKTTQAKILAERLGFVYVDTGAMYRTIAVYMKRNNKTLDDIPEVLETINMQLVRLANGAQAMYLDDLDVTGMLRTPEISSLASDVSAIPVVRKFLLDAQRELVQTNDVVMEGRDIGTVIIPDATLKIFLTASLERRAARRSLEMKYAPPLKTLIEDMRTRDYNDSHRAEAPLKQAADAILVDCTEMSIEETTATILRLWMSRQGH